MKKPYILIILIAFAGHSFSQHVIDIPKFTNLNPTDKYPERSVLATYLDQFDLLISFKRYAALPVNEKTEVLAHYSSGWYKIEINTEHREYKSFKATCYLGFALPDSIGDHIWKVINENHFFDLVDERTRKIPCTVADDGPEYQFELLTNTNYKKLYFYGPRYFNEKCPDAEERKQVVNCIKVFEKYLGN